MPAETFSGWVWYIGERARRERAAIEAVRARSESEADEEPEVDQGELRKQLGI